VRCGATLGKLVTEKPVDFVGFDNVVDYNKKLSKPTKANLVGIHLKRSLITE
jgi:hypothetical protein